MTKKKYQIALCLCGNPPKGSKFREDDRCSIPIVQNIRCATITCDCGISAHLATREEAVKLWNKHVQEKADKAILEATIIVKTLDAPGWVHNPVIHQALMRSYDKASEDYVRLEKVLESIQN